MKAIPLLREEADLEYRKNKGVFLLKGEVFNSFRQSYMKRDDKEELRK